MDIYEKSLEFHEGLKGKLSINSKVSLESRENLSLAYTPGVAEPCRRIKEDSAEAYRYTGKGNLVAVVTDGSAVLGLGDIGALAGLPVMEGKALLFKEFAGVDAFPICIDSKDTEEIIRTVKLISPGFGGINLEDIAAPRCFEIEKRLKEELDIPVFHDDQHGTAVVVTAGLINSLKIVKKELSEIEVVINGSGAAGIAIANMLIALGVGNVILCDRAGIITEENANNPYKKEVASKSNKGKKSGSLEEALTGADVFIGVSAPGVLSKDMIKKMNKDSIIFALANPVPEIMPEEALEAGARIYASGRSDFQNQINNVLAFPGIFRGALDVRASEINEEMKIAAAKAIAGMIEDKDLREDYIIPSSLDKSIAMEVSKAVAREGEKN